MNIATNYESPLVLKNIMITEGTFKRSEDSLEDVELQVNVSHNVNQISDREYKTNEITGEIEATGKNKGRRYKRRQNDYRYDRSYLPIGACGPAARRLYLMRF